VRSKRKDTGSLAESNPAWPGLTLYFFAAFFISVRARVATQANANRICSISYGDARGGSGDTFRCDDISRRGYGGLLAVE